MFCVHYFIFWLFPIVDLHSHDMAKPHFHTLKRQARALRPKENSFSVRMDSYEHTSNLFTYKINLFFSFRADEINTYPYYYARCNWIDRIITIYEQNNYIGWFSFIKYNKWKCIRNCKSGKGDLVSVTCCKYDLSKTLYHSETLFDKWKFWNWIGDLNLDFFL